MRPEMRRHGASRRSSRPKKVRPSAVPPQGLHLGRTGHIPRDCVGSAPDKPTRTWAPSVRPEMRRHGASRRSSRPKKVCPSAVPPQGLHLGRTGHIPRDCVGSAPDKPTRTWAPSVRPEMRRHGASRRSSRPKKVRPSAVPPQGLHLGRTGHIPRDCVGSAPDKPTRTWAPSDRPEMRRHGASRRSSRPKKVRTGGFYIHGPLEPKVTQEGQFAV